MEEKELAKKKIGALVEKYRKVLIAHETKGYTEQDTKNAFISPLFAALGWDIENRQEVTSEEQISGDRVDYGFYINGRPKFYLEAKPLRADLNDPKYARQAIKYAWNKGVTWAVLTDFEGIKVFNAEFQAEELAHSKFFEISWDQYEDQFDKLWLLSKDSFLKGEIDRQAEAWGKALKRVSVTESLYKDLTECRKLLTESLKRWNESVSEDLLDEGVQKLLNRLVFIRVLEDREIEPHILKNLVRGWESSHYEKGRPPLYSIMVQKFRELDVVYDSNLFNRHPFEDWGEHDNYTKKVIDILYGRPGYYEYDFKIIPADILGAVYENYLGYKLEKSKKGTKAGKDDKKRKEHGIYYTPEFIVDYIIKNSLNPILKECQSFDEVAQIKVLDPACGSGSFLIKVVDAIYQRYCELGYNNSPTFKKIQIISQNVYGVDLDQQAVEIARLNLLINAVDEKVVLPNLAGNIKWGNSLIYGSDEELVKYFGKNYRDKIAFNWQEEFQDVFTHNGNGFDVIVGNPPYVRNRELNKEDKEFFTLKFISASGQYDLYQLFFEQAISLLKSGGFLGFITSNKYTIASYGKKLREYILANSKIHRLLDVSNLNVFKDASTYPLVIILEKTVENEGHMIKAYRAFSDLELESKPVVISQNSILESKSKNFTVKEDSPLFSKIETISAPLGEIASIKETIHTGNVREKLIVDQKVDDTCKKLLAGKDCHRYWFNWSGKYIRYDKSLINKDADEYGNLPDKKHFEEKKILLRDISKYPEAVLDEEKFYTVNTLYSIQLLEDTKLDLYFVLALLNSKLIKFWFSHKFEDAHVSGGYLRFKKIYTSQIPIYKVDSKNKEQKSLHDQLAELAKKASTLYQDLNSTPENSERWNQLKSEAEKVDKRINQEVYKLYNLTEEEVQTIDVEE